MEKTQISPTGIWKLSNPSWFFYRKPANSSSCSAGPSSWLPSPGFTLIELSIVILLSTLLLSIALPRLSDLTEASLRSEARRISALMRYVFSEAAFRKTYFALVFDLDKGEYWVESPIINPLTQEMEMVKVENDALFSIRRLPTGIKIQDINLGDQVIGEAKAVIHFYPGGYVDPATIHLTDSKKREYSIFIIPLSGRVLVRKGYFEFSGYDQS